MMQGYLSYTLAVVAILGAGAGFFLGIVDLPTATAMAWAGLSVFGLRRAVAKNGTGK
jgi:hypothetical protein